MTQGLGGSKAQMGTVSVWFGSAIVEEGVRPKGGKSPARKPHYCFGT